MVGALSIGILDPVSENRAFNVARNGLHGLTGAGGSFGFFSPNIGNQVLIDFRLDDGRTVRLHETVPREVALRLGNMYRLFIETYGNDKLKRSVAASLSAQIFRRYPETKRVTLVASVFRFPSLADYANGVPSETKEVYRIVFETNRALCGVRRVAN